MSTDDENLLRLIDDAKTKFHQYADTQTNFQMPQAHISIEPDSNEITKVHIDVQHNGIQYYFKSVQETDINDIYQYLNSQPAVRAKYTNGNTCSLEATATRVHTLVSRFQDKRSPLYLYSGFVVSDSQTETFLGFANVGGGLEPGTTEIAYMNREEFWSRSSNAVSNTCAGMNINSPDRKTYAGVGTVEACTLVQYAVRLKEEGHTINGQPLKAIVATARVDNEGSWKCSIKAGMTLHDVDIVHRYGSQLRYQLRKNI